MPETGDPRHPSFFKLKINHRRRLPSRKSEPWGNRFDAPELKLDLGVEACRLVGLDPDQLSLQAPFPEGLPAPMASSPMARQLAPASCVVKFCKKRSGCGLEINGCIIGKSSAGVPACGSPQSDVNSPLFGVFLSTLFGV